MWGSDPDHCPEPASESDSSDASLSPCAPLESPEDSMLDLPLDPPLKGILKKGGDGKGEVRKRGGESSDSGKESDEENKMDEEEGGGEEDYEGEDEREDEYEDFHDCEGFEDRGEYSWNCYLTTIEEEEEEEVEPETEELLIEEEDSGNDSDLEKSELETFEMLEKLCEIESKEKGEKTERGRIQSYHEYKRLKEAAPVIVEYKNQIVVEKDLNGVKIKPVDVLEMKEDGNGSLDGLDEMPETNDGDRMADFDMEVGVVFSAQVQDEMDCFGQGDSWTVQRLEEEICLGEEPGGENGLVGDKVEECFVQHLESVGGEMDLVDQSQVPQIRVSGDDDDDDDDNESVLEIKVSADFDSDDIPSPWMVHKSDLRAVKWPRSFLDNPQVVADDDVDVEPVDSNSGGDPPGESIPGGLRPSSEGGINRAERGAPVTLRAPMKHDPDTKIKSALKRASSKKRKKHKVQFDESLNKFFEADYVILIREECGGGGCDCGGGDYCYADEDDSDDVAPVAALDLAPFDPPVEFVDQLTLSPPDGYKDHCLHHGPTPDDDKGTERWPPEEPKCEDGQTQTTPTSESEDNDGSISDVPDKKERYIVETITMTTVTERRIIREAEEAQGASVHAPPLVSKDKEMTLTFKLGSNSLKPNSALRQLFPRIASPPPDKSPDSDDDSLQSNLIKRTIERNTLRRSLVRYPDIRKRAQAKKNENSLVERIKKLTCDIDDDETTPPSRSSPTGEESKENAVHESTSTTTVLETSKIPAYRKITDIFIRNKEPHPVVLQAPASVEHQYPYYQPYNPPDLGNGMPKARQTHEARKQFLSSLAPLTACVSSHIDDTPGSRDSTSTVDTDYSIGDIDDVLKEQKPQPDIVVGTPGNESDELALFVQQDASRIERLRKRYSSAGSDDEQDDYGFNRRPSVRGIKPRFGSTTEILQQMQSQIAPPLPSGSHVSWPYYPPDDRNGRYVEEPHYSQNVIHVQQGQSVRLPYQAGPVQLHLMGGPQSRQVVVRGTQTISTYYQIPRAAPEQFPRGPLVYYPRSPVCGSPTKMKLERGVPEGASASPHQEQAALLPPPPGPPGSLPPGPPVPAQALPVTDPPLMYAMNV